MNVNSAGRYSNKSLFKRMNTSSNMPSGGSSSVTFCRKCIMWKCGCSPVGVGGGGGGGGQCATSVVAAVFMCSVRE